jgi:hypothetical protein
MMRVKVLGVAVDDDGRETPVDVWLDVGGESRQADGSVCVYGMFDAWSADVPATQVRGADK